MTTSLLNSYFSGTLQRGADVVAWGSRSESLEEKTLASGQAILNDCLVIPAGEVVTVWNWAMTSGFELAKFWLRDGEGFLYYGARVDPVTSPTDETPASTGKWNTTGSLSCHDCMNFTSDRAYYLATAADNVGDSAGHSSLLASGSRVLGVYSVIEFSNEGTEDAYLRRLVVQ